MRNDTIRILVRYGAMDTLPEPAAMTDEALITEYGETDFDHGDWRRTDALIAELGKRDLEF